MAAPVTARPIARLSSETANQRCQYMILGRGTLPLSLLLAVPTQATAAMRLCTCFPTRFPYPMGAPYSTLRPTRITSVPARITMASSTAANPVTGASTDRWFVATTSGASAEARNTWVTPSSVKK